MSDLLKGVRSRLDAAIERAKTEADRQHAHWQAAVDEHDRLVAARDLIDGKSHPPAQTSSASSAPAKRPKKAARGKPQQKQPAKAAVTKTRKKRPMRHKSGLGRVQATVLAYVIEHPGLPAAKISQATGTGPSAYSAIKGLADSNLLVEAGTDGDGRATYKAADNAKDVLDGTTSQAGKAPSSSPAETSQAEEKGGSAKAAGTAVAKTATASS